MSLLDPTYIERATNLCLCGLSKGVEYYRSGAEDCVYLWDNEIKEYCVSYKNREPDKDAETYPPGDFGGNHHWVPYGICQELRDKLSALLFF